MGKSKGGKSKGFISQGQHSNVSRGLRSEMRSERTSSERLLNKTKAYWAGKNPWITIDNPNKEQTNKRFIRVKANTLWGTPKERLNPQNKKS